MIRIFITDYVTNAILLMTCWLITILGIRQFNNNSIFLFICFVFCYILGLILVSDSKWYRNIQRQKLEEYERTKLSQRERSINQRINNLCKTERLIARELLDICNKLKKNLNDATLIAKVDETIDIYFNILEVQENCISFSNTENKSTIDKKIEINRIRLDEEADERIKDSIKNILASLTQRKNKLDDAVRNTKIIELEKERLIEQIKLLYADSLTNLDSNIFTTKMESNFKTINQIKSLMQDLGDRLEL